MPTLPQPLFVNLWTRRAAGRASWQADLFLAADDAAADAASPSLYCYAGTVALWPAAPPRLLDLSAHGAAVLADRLADAAAEAAHERGLRQGAGRRVL